MPSITKRFNRSIYATLGLACACLGYAEWDLLPEVSVFAAAVLVLLAFAYRREGRWSLSIGAANVLGGVIAVFAIAWLSFQLMRPDGLFEQLPGPSASLPFLGPLLMILIPAKLFRPKHHGDFWGLQGIGLIAVALGCALTGDPVFGILLFAYFASAIWSLTLFYYFRHEEGTPAAPRLAAIPSVFGRTAQWAFAVSVLAIVFFLITPRVTEARWELSSYTSRMQTGVDDNRPGIDLNRSGTLTVNRERVFEARAFTKDCPNPPPKLDLDPGQRWRQTEFNYYDHGRWVKQDFGPVSSPRRGTRWGYSSGPRQLADLGAGQYYFEFRLVHTGNEPAYVFAEPVASRIGSDGKVRFVDSPRPLGASRFSASGPADADPVPPFGTRGTYDQVVLPTDEPGVSPPRRIEDGFAEQLRNCHAVPRLQTWSRQLLREMVATGRLPKAALGAPTVDPRVPTWIHPALLHLAVAGGWLPAAVLKTGAPGDRVPPAQYEAVGRAFESYLARSGRFRYSMTLKRQDNEIDPIEDFVLNTREGHCTRFATALAMMLRCVGVPAQVVLGYRGYETPGNGTYEVLQCHAHSWVEAIIYRPSDKPETPPWRWLTLDPTPTAEETTDSDFTWTNWWEHTRQGMTSFFKTFIVDYDADQQERARTAMSQAGWSTYPQRAWRTIMGAGNGGWALGALMLLGSTGLVLIGRRIRRRRADRAEPTDPAAVFYDRLLIILGRQFGLVRRMGQTPREFAAAAGGHLRLIPATNEMANLPTDTVAMYYRIRFGRQAVLAEDRDALDARLDALEAAIEKQ